jgi:hypothetical protein
MNQKIKKPIFLVGCMRSGTTMLADLLGQHPNIIHCPFELRGVWSRAGNVPMASPKTHDRKCPCLKETDVRPGQAERLSRAFIAEMKKNKGSRNINHATFLNKNPHLGNKLPFVNALFPDARFIWIYRDMPSVAASLKKILNRKVIHYWPEKEEPETVRCWECFFNGVPAQVNRERCFPGGDVKYLAEYWYEKVLTDCQSFLGVPINLPRKIIGKIDRNRNELWNKRLNDKEIKSLLNFVIECGDDLNFIFPEDNLFDRYIKLVSTELLQERGN